MILLILITLCLFGQFTIAGCILAAVGVFSLVMTLCGVSLDS